MAEHTHRPQPRLPASSVGLARTGEVVGIRTLTHERLRLASANLPFRLRQSAIQALAEPESASLDYMSNRTYDGSE